MKIQVGNSEYEVDWDGEKFTIQLKLDNFCDIIKFRNWDKKRKNSSHKKDYIKKLLFYSQTKKGYLNNCYPIFNSYNNLVFIHFDSYEEIK